MTQPQLDATSKLRELFPGHYRLTEEQLEAMWSGAIVVFDANVLLNAYRYSAETWRQLLQAIEPLREQLWLPYQIAHEFHDNRIRVIQAQTQSYADASTKIQQLEAILNAPRSHPFIDLDLLAETTRLFRQLRHELALKEQEVESLLAAEDGRLNQIVDLFHQGDL